MKESFLTYKDKRETRVTQYRKFSDKSNTFFQHTLAHLSSVFTNNITLVFFQNEEVFVQLDELDKLDRIIHV